MPKIYRWTDSITNFTQYMIIPCKDFYRYEKAFLRQKKIQSKRLKKMIKKQKKFKRFYVEIETHKMDWAIPRFNYDKAQK